MLNDCRRNRRVFAGEGQSASDRTDIARGCDRCASVDKGFELLATAGLGRLGRRSRKERVGGGSAVT